MSATWACLAPACQIQRQAAPTRVARLQHAARRAALAPCLPAPKLVVRPAPAAQRPSIIGVPASPHEMARGAPTDPPCKKVMHRLPAWHQAMGAWPGRLTCRTQRGGSWGPPARWPRPAPGRTCRRKQERRSTTSHGPGEQGRAEGIPRHPTPARSSAHLPTRAGMLPTQPLTAGRP